MSQTEHVGHLNEKKKVKENFHYQFFKTRMCTWGTPVTTEILQQHKLSSSLLPHRDLIASTAQAIKHMEFCV